MEIYPIILVLAVVQSLFGVGLLLFGTPLLLILGYEYQEALLYLLPASAAISWSQVWDLRAEKLDQGYRFWFLLICIPCLIGGMLLSQGQELRFYLKVFVTIMLFVAFILRTSTKLRLKLQALMKRHLKYALGSMGFIHGLTNMGGSILTPMVSSLYQSKVKILAGISFDYAFMASFQLIVLTLIQGHRLTVNHLSGSLLALTIRYLIGKKVFSFTEDLYYQRLLNGFILANAIILSLSFK